jgi:DNA-binding transcriptional LysR family regulator
MTARRAAFKEMRIQQLRGFAVCARLGNLSQAAGELGLSRPALWQQLRALERDFSADFFRRRRHGVELTDDGRLFLELTEPLLAGFNSLKQIFDERRGRRARVLRVACPDSIQQNEMVEVVNEFHRRHPQVALAFVEAWSARVPALVLAGEVQVGIEGMPGKVRDSRLLYHRLFDRDIFLVVPKNHPLSARKRPTLSDLIEHPFVMEPPISRLREHVASVFEAAGLQEKWQIVLDTPSERFLLETVAHGLVISLITAGRRDPPHPKVKLIPANHLFGSFPVYLVRRPAVNELEHQRQFREALSAAFAAGHATAD